MIGGVLLFSTLPFFSLGVPIKGQLKEAMALAYKEYNEAIMPTLSMERRTEYDIGPFLRWWSSYSLTLYESENEIILSLTLCESESEIMLSLTLCESEIMLSLTLCDIFFQDGSGVDEIPAHSHVWNHDNLKMTEILMKYFLKS